MADVPHDLDYDSKVQRLKRRYQGLSRVAAAINDLYIYGVYPSNFPNLSVTQIIPSRFSSIKSRASFKNALFEIFGVDFKLSITEATFNF